jgi:DNA replication protein DnaC
MNNLDFKKIDEQFREIDVALKPDCVEIKIPDAEENLFNGIKYFTAERAKWLLEYKHVAEWLSDNNGRGLLLVGNCGLGKSLLCRQVIPMIINYYYRKIVHIFDATDLNKKSMTDKILSSHLTCIDDLGTENELNDFGNRRIVFCELADRAEKDGKMLLITTNLSEEELRQKYGERTIDRLHAITRKIVFRGDSLRR